MTALMNLKVCAAARISALVLVQGPLRRVWRTVASPLLASGTSRATAKEPRLTLLLPSEQTCKVASFSKFSGCGNAGSMVMGTGERARVNFAPICSRDLPPRSTLVRCEV